VQAVDSDFILKALNYGVIGFSAVCLVVVARILSIEQKREGYPRQGIIKLCISFMVFCFALAGLSAYLQIQDEKKFESLKADITKQSGRLNTVGFQLSQIHDTLCSKVYLEAMPSSLNAQFRSNKALVREFEDRKKAVAYVVQILNTQLQQAATTAGASPTQIPPCPNH
jgi:hypothetical protein